MAKSSFDKLLQEVRDEAKAEALKEVAGMLGDLVAKLTGKVAVRGRPAGSGAAKKADGIPTGAVWDESGKGRKECPNCKKFVAARGGDCPHCGYNFAQAKVVAYPDHTMPFFAGKGKGKGKAKAAVADTDAAVQKAALKQLKKSMPAGITVKDLVGNVASELDMKPSEVTAGVKATINAHGQKGENSVITLKAAA